MEKAKVYYSDLRTSPTSNLLDKMERLLKRAGIEQLPLSSTYKCNFLGADNKQ